MKILKPNKSQAKVKAANKKQASKKLPPDTYEPMIKAVNVDVDEARHFVINVQRSNGGDNDMGLPCVDIRTYQTTEAYTGYTKKGINLPLDILPDLIEALQEVSETCESKGFYKEYEE